MADTEVAQRREALLAKMALPPEKGGYVQVKHCRWKRTEWQGKEVDGFCALGVIQNEYALAQGIDFDQVRDLVPAFQYFGLADFNSRRGEITVRNDLSEWSLARIAQWIRRNRFT